ncbi:MAG TPA: hypothetical protein VNL91_06375, partial [Thermoanaerobaculia bacterium]|nr:hypothetical protein [Thermoanaerobaculia bacterium]
MKLLRVAIAFLALVVLAGAAYGQSCPFPAPTLTAPPDGATNVDLELTLRWTPAAGATRYEVWAADDGSSEFYLVGDTTETSMAVEVAPATDIEWYVAAVHPACKAPSARFRFRTIGCSDDVAVPLSPPDEGFSGSPVTFRWTGVDGAYEYRLWVYSFTYEDFVAYYATDFTEISVRLQPDEYAWLIETAFDECESTYSEYSYFTIQRR